MSILSTFYRGLDFFRAIYRLPKHLEKQILLQGKFLAENVGNRHSISSLFDVEFGVFSQFGDDGIIQWLIQHLELTNHTFIEFGVGDYQESNTRFLLMNNNWSGFIMDGSKSNIARVIRSDYFWKHDLTARSIFIDRENINSILKECHFGEEVGLLHIDLDGVDYWIWKQINVISPIILILEYNSVFGKERAITVPYVRDFHRTKAHFSNLYWGASLLALQHLSAQKGYSLVGSNSAGNNAYFVRTDKLNTFVRQFSVDKGYVESRYKESRDRQGQPTFLRRGDRLNLLKGMPIYNVITDQIETI
jgi:hypothetical protein